MSIARFSTPILRIINRKRHPTTAVCIWVAAGAGSIALVTLSAHAAAASATRAPAALSAASPDLQQQFQPSKDDDGGTDKAESEELLYQWQNPQYSSDERAQLDGLAAYFAVLAGGIYCVRLKAKNRLRQHS